MANKLNLNLKSDIKKGKSISMEHAIFAPEIYKAVLTKLI